VNTKNVGVEASIQMMPNWSYGFLALSQLKEVMISGFLTRN
jgi:hypothetical protein